MFQVNQLELQVKTHMQELQRQAQTERLLKSRQEESAQVASIRKTPVVQNPRNQPKVAGH